MSVDGQDGEPVRVTTGLPQGFPISPVLFALCIAEILGAVEGQVEDSRGISFVDDITWIVEGGDIDDVTNKWGDAPLPVLGGRRQRSPLRGVQGRGRPLLEFSKRRKHRRCEREIRAGTHRVRFRSWGHAMAGHLARLHAQPAGAGSKRPVRPRPGSAA